MLRLSGGAAAGDGDGVRYHEGVTMMDGVKLPSSELAMVPECVEVPGCPTDLSHLITQGGHWS